MKKLFLSGILITILTFGVVASSYIPVPVYDEFKVKNREDQVFNGDYPVDLNITAVRYEKAGDYRNKYEVQINILVTDSYFIYSDYPVSVAKSENVRIWGNTSRTDHPYSGNPLYMTDGEGRIMMWAELIEGTTGHIDFDAGNGEYRVLLEYMY